MLEWAAHARRFYRLYKVHFRLRDEDFELVAHSLDLTHPYFVSIKDFDFTYQEGLVVNPHLENTKKRFKNTTSIMIPFQSVILIEVVRNKEKTKETTKNDIKVVSLKDDSDPS